MLSELERNENKMIEENKRILKYGKGIKWTRYIFIQSVCLEVRMIKPTIEKVRRKMQPNSYP